MQAEAAAVKRVERQADAVQCAAVRLYYATTELPVSDEDALAAFDKYLSKKPAKVTPSLHPVYGPHWGDDDADGGAFAYLPGGWDNPGGGARIAAT